MAEQAPKPELRGARRGASLERPPQLQRHRRGVVAEREEADGLQQATGAAFRRRETGVRQHVSEAAFAGHRQQARESGCGGRRGDRVERWLEHRRLDEVGPAERGEVRRRAGQQRGGSGDDAEAGLSGGRAPRDLSVAAIARRYSPRDRDRSGAAIAARIGCPRFRSKSAGASPRCTAAARASRQAPLPFPSDETGGSRCSHPACRSARAWR